MGHIHVCVFFFRSGEQIPLHCVTRHPTQHHVIAAGGHDGVLSVWDLRHGKYPVTLLEAHSAASMYMIIAHTMFFLPLKYNCCTYQLNR